MSYYERFDRFFAARNFMPKAILEVGVHLGDSTKILATAYPEAKIIGLDSSIHKIDFSDFPNISYFEANQGDAAGIDKILTESFPDGIDLVIDDASHIGALTCVTFYAVFPHLRSGGIYIIEDWGTGYWDDYPDGCHYQAFPMQFTGNMIPKRIPSHDFGMVGFVKSLVDMTSEGDIRPTQDSPVVLQTRLSTLEFSAGICIAQKA
jgi:hypothetical protein